MLESQHLHIVVGATPLMALGLAQPMASAGNGLSTDAGTFGYALSSRLLIAFIFLYILTYDVVARTAAKRHKA